MMKGLEFQRCYGCRGSSKRGSRKNGEPHHNYQVVLDEMMHTEKKLTDVFKTIEVFMNPNETKAFHLCLMER